MEIPIGVRIAKERKRRKVTREQIAQELKRSPSLVRQWELGFSEPTDENRAAIEKWLSAANGRRGT